MVVRQFARISSFKLRKSVLVLDTNGNNPAQHDLFNVNCECSLNEVITDGGPVEKAYCQVAGTQLFVCLVSGNSRPFLPGIEWQRTLGGVQNSFRSCPDRFSTSRGIP